MTHYVILGGIWDGVMHRDYFHANIERIGVDGDGRKVLLQAPSFQPECPESERTYHLDGNVAELWAAWAIRVLSGEAPIIKREWETQASQAAASHLMADLSRALDKVYGLTGDRGTEGKSEAQEVDVFLKMCFLGDDPRE